MFSAATELSWLERALSAFRQVRAAVLGDFCLDAYWVMDPEKTELSVETGLPVRHVRNQKYSLGGAGNVVANLIALGVGSVQAIGAVGADPFGVELLRLLRERNAAVTDRMIVDEQWQTMVYVKPYCGDEEESRIDFGAYNALREKTINALISALDTAALESDVVVLNQQVQTGLSKPAVIERINEVIAKHRDKKFVVDARHHPGLYRGAVLKLNMQEAAEFLDSAADNSSTEHAKHMARRISEQTGKPTFITRGERGIVVADHDAVYDIPGIEISEKTDPVGAGDTVVATIAAGIGSDQQPSAIASLANIAAAITVRKLQTTGTATGPEILAAGAPDYVFAPELADMLHAARYIAGSEIEYVGDLPLDLQIEHCIFDHDGTLSTLREGWEKIMEPMMVRAILGPRYETASAAALAKTTHEVRAFIDRTTGIQTLVQMKGLVELVKQAGFTDETEILDEHGYKRIYIEELFKLVRQRIRKLQSGELSPTDFEIKNAALLLQELHKRGMKLYLASGSDEADVISEATLMGYAHLFEGHIYGAVGDVKVEAKRMVLERIIRENGLKGHQFATFGDGPVEVRETQKRGGVCIGVASDEVRRFGLNLAKRSRLIRAGANLIIPDFSQLSALLHAMQLS